MIDIFGLKLRDQITITDKRQDTFLIKIKTCLKLFSTNHVINCQYILTSSTGDVKLTQSNAILRHISRKHGLDGKTDAEKDLVNMMEHEVMDFRLGLVKISYDPNFVSFL
jgi:hypothetical protein